MAPREALTRRQVAGRWLGNQLVRFRFLSPLQVGSDYLRAARLKRGRWRALPQAADAGARGTRVVVSLTTVPDRASRIVPTLLSLLEQTRRADRIVLALPDSALRTGLPYPDPPRLPSGIDLLRCADSGPSTKLLPALLAEPGALVVAVDDDVIYPQTYLETLLAAHRRHPRAALGWRGWRIEPGVNPKHFRHVWASAVTAPVAVDILLGWGGYLIPPGALDGAVHDYEGWPDAVRWVDDVWVSGHLARRGVARLVVPGRTYPVARAGLRVSALSTGPNASGSNDRRAIEAFAGWW